MANCPTNHRFHIANIEGSVEMALRLWKFIVAPIGSLSLKFKCQLNTLIIILMAI